jgi:hypothetical protein
MINNTLLNVIIVLLLFKKIKTKIYKFYTILILLIVDKVISLLLNFTLRR